jgi:hypothetical protein
VVVDVDAWSVMILLKKKVLLKKKDKIKILLKKKDKIKITKVCEEMVIL